MDTLGLRNAPLATPFEIITLTNTGTDLGLGGLTEVQAFELVPEPASLGLLLVGGVMLLEATAMCESVDGGHEFSSLWRRQSCVSSHNDNTGSRWSSFWW